MALGQASPWGQPCAETRPRAFRRCCVRDTQTYKTQVHWNGADWGQLSSILPHHRSVLSQPSQGSLSLLPATGEPGRMREVPGWVSGLPEETYSAFLFI